MKRQVAQALGLLGLVLGLAWLDANAHRINLEWWLRRRPKADPTATLKWEVLAEAEQIIRDAAGGDQA